MGRKVEGGNARLRTADGLRVVDLFSGSGAVTTALIRSRFRVIAAVDNDPVACATYRANHPEVLLVESDIREVDPCVIATERTEARNIDLLVVCAPCQPFSSQNRRRGTDPRALLLLESVRFAAVLNPKCIFFENVPGLTSPANQHVLSALKTRLLALGYLMSESRSINAADLGVPQRRIRCVMIASRSASALEHFTRIRFKQRQATVRTAIGQLRALSNGESDPQDRLHRARTHSALALSRLANIPKNGGGRFSLPPHLELKCHRGTNAFPDVYGRMCWDDVAPTLTTGCDDFTRGRFVHPDQDRAITLREAALLQTFPLRYQFIGNRREIARQIGNAVPIRMFQSLGPALRTAIRLSIASTT
jgi:DNA (cytosine-5)-methyltransferase 1